MTLDEVREEIQTAMTDEKHAMHVVFKSDPVRWAKFREALYSTIPGSEKPGISGWAIDGGGPKPKAR